MTMTTKRQQRRATDTGPVTVRVTEPHLVFHDGEQRGGTLTDVPADVAEHWERHGWVTTVQHKPTKPKAAPKPEPTK